jgi:hypothetical protein
MAEEKARLEAARVAKAEAERSRREAAREEKEAWQHLRVIVQDVEHAARCLAELERNGASP